MFVFPITLGCFQSRSAVPNSLNCQTRLPSIIALLPFPSLPFLGVSAQWAMPTLTFSIITHDHYDLVTKCSAFWFIWQWKGIHIYESDADNCKMLTKLSWKRYNARNVAVNWSELVCSPPRRQPLSIRPLQGSETNTQIQIQRHK